MSTLDFRTGWRRVIWSLRGRTRTSAHQVLPRRDALVPVYLHHLHTSDEDRALHDHPWSVHHVPPERRVRGAYADGPTWRRWGSVLYRPAEWAHRISLTRPVWTLVIRSGRRRVWGFWTDGEWMDYRTYGSRFCD